MTIARVTQSLVPPLNPAALRPPSLYWNKGAEALKPIVLIKLFQKGPAYLHAFLSKSILSYRSLLTDYGHRGYVWILGVLIRRMRIASLGFLSAPPAQ